MEPPAAFFEAIQAGDAAAVRKHLTADPHLIHAHSGDGWTPLHLAAYFGHSEVAEVLLEHGADLHAASANAMRNTPLHAALAGTREPSVIDRLVMHGADVNAAAADGVAPLHLAASRGDLLLIEQLLAHGARPARMENGQTPAAIAAERGHPEAAARLREAEAEPGD